VTPQRKQTEAAKKPTKKPEKKPAKGEKAAKRAEPGLATPTAHTYARRVRPR
jgi:hypothetical protein